MYQSLKNLKEGKKLNHNFKKIDKYSFKKKGQYHLEYKLDNFDINIIDYGMSRINRNRRTKNEVGYTLYYKSPEVIMGNRPTTKVDIWALGCTIYEMITGNLLFDTKKGKYYDREQYHLLQIREMLGSFPGTFLKGRKYKNFFNKKGRLIYYKELPNFRLDTLLSEHLNPQETKECVNFLKECMLCVNVEKRKTAKECLDHPWLN